MSGVATAFVTIIFNVLASDFNVSTSLLTCGLHGRPGSLSAGAFNQLNEVNYSLNNPLLTLVSATSLYNSVTTFIKDW